MKILHKQAEWYKAQTRVLGWLRGRGISARLAGYYSPFDLCTKNGTRVEVKWCPGRKLSNSLYGWNFNIHRHGKIDHSQVDFYIFRCELDPHGDLKKIGLSKALHLVIPPSALSGTTFSISVRSIMDRRWANFVNNTEIIQEFEENKNGNTSK